MYKVIIFLCFVVFCASSAPTVVDVFSAGENGYMCIRIPVVLEVGGTIYALVCTFIPPSYFSYLRKIIIIFFFHIGRGKGTSFEHLQLLCITRYYKIVGCTK